MAFNDFVKLIIDIFPFSHIQINAQPYSLNKSKSKAKSLIDKHKALKELFESNFKSKEECLDKFMELLPDIRRNV